MLKYVLVRILTAGVLFALLAAFTFVPASAQPAQMVGLYFSRRKK